MDAREKLRLRLTRDVLRLVRKRDFRSALPTLRPDGTAPIYVGFRDESIESIVARIDELGGVAHLMVPKEDADSWAEGITLMRVNLAGRARSEATEDDCQIKETTDLGMMLLWLVKRHTREATFVVSRKETHVELVDKGEDLASV